MNINNFVVSPLERFFISGCQRSGTTMLRLVLESHSSIQCFDEAMGYDILVKEMKGEIVDFSVKAGSVLLGFKIPRFTEQLTQAEFNECDYGSIPSFYRGQKVVHVFRDALDVIASMMKLKVAGGVSWIDKYGRIILQSMMVRQDVRSVFKKKYEHIEKMGLPAHLVGALYWEVKNQGFFELLEKRKPVYAVGYERLVSSPRDELLKLCQFLELEWSEALLDHPTYPHAELDENGRAIGDTDPRRGIDTNSVGGHCSLMTNTQISEVRHFVEDMSSQIDSVLTT